jgi:hypothetical protein
MDETYSALSSARFRRVQVLETDTMSAETGYAVEMDGITRRFGDFPAVDRVTLVRGELPNVAEMRWF